jgi:hypothetical protein
MTLDISCNELITNNLLRFTDRYHNLALWLAVLTLAAVVMSYLNKGKIEILGNRIVTIPKQFQISDKRYIEYTKYLNVGFVGVSVFLLFPLL